MKTREISKENWQGFFDKTSRALKGKLIQIEVDSLEIGAQIEVDMLSLNGITYDSKDEALIVSTDEIEHVIPAVQHIFVTEGSKGMDSLEVRSAGGRIEIIKFSEPLALSPPHQA